ncbi:MAG TPA: ATP-binding protein [Prolixibacteraceae bacterium]|nr:ATP-binding protein [Prolixibacteraceae bacterium]
MSYKIAIASGKGGTGKTTVAVNLFKYLNEIGTNTLLVDCDVEEPNDFIFFDFDTPPQTEIVNQLVPKIDTSKCTFCRKCSDYCIFNAISIIPSVQHAEVTTSLCHSCGACLVACEFGAITEYSQEIGTISRYNTSFGSKLIEGRLKVGSPMQTLMVKAVKKAAENNCDITLFDSPPGTSCPVVETVSDANYVVLVTEPTPFGLHDFKLMVTLLREMNKPFDVVVNKAGSGNSHIYQYIQEENIELLGNIPFLKQYAQNYAHGKIFENIPDEIALSYKTIAGILIEKMKNR